MSLVVVSNRLPISLKRKGGEWHVFPGSGGLVTALNPILKKHGGSWIGWLGTSDKGDFTHVLEEAEKEMGYTLSPVRLTKQEVEEYYQGFSNEILWPLFHCLETRCNFKPKYWEAYSSVNQKFAQVILEKTHEKDFIWVQDYHLMEVAHHMQGKRQLGFFLHIPFPPPDVFLKLPWRTEILQSLLEFETIGVHTANDCRNFIETVKRIRPLEVKVTGTNGVKEIAFRGKKVKLGVFPISIDYEAFASKAAENDVAKKSWLFHEEFPGKKIILGTDRLDYTKGIPERIEAYRRALEKYPEMHKKVLLVQVLVPSRVEVPEYEKLKTEVERLIGETNGQFGVPGWTPIQYYYRNLPQEELISYYRAAEIAWVTSLRDGMNLVAKEYVACNIEENGVLILSEFTGAAAEFHKGALLINPYDIEGSADALYHAFVMPEVEKRKRMRILRNIVKTKDIDHWVDTFLKVALSKKGVLHPHAQEYIPTIDVEQ